MRCTHPRVCVCVKHVFLKLFYFIIYFPVVYKQQISAVHILITYLLFMNYFRTIFVLFSDEIS